MYKKHLLWIIPLVLFAVIAPFTPEWDLLFSNSFYLNNQFSEAPFYVFMYDYGYYPAFAMTVISFILYVGSFFKKNWLEWRKASLFLFLVSAIGVGLIVHFALKDQWGRPRPRQTIEFGGKQPYRPFYEPYFSNPIPSKSFPCGHCSGGFYFVALTFLGWRFAMSWLYYLGIILTLFLGISLSITRIAQGGHFFSDVVASALIMWLTALFLDWIIFSKKRVPE